MANKVYTVGTATFAANTIPDILSMDFSHGADPNNFFCDGAIYSEFAWMENIVERCTVNTTDFSIIISAGNFSPGDTGAVVQNFPQRAEGVGGKAASSTALIATWVAGTMLGPINPSASQAGENSLALPFIGISADGTTCPVSIALGTAA